MHQVTVPRATAQQALHVATAAGYPVALIAALRAALEQPKPPPEAQTEAERLAYCAGWCAAMEQKREQPAQEPVATVEIVVPHLESIVIKHILGAHFPQVGDYLYTQPPRRESAPEQEDASCK